MAPGGYRADAREARTDLLLGGFSVAKAACAAVMYFAVIVASASRHPSSALLFLGAASAAAASRVAIDRAADVLAKRRGRPARDLAALGMQAAKIVRLFWFMPLIPLLASTGLPGSASAGSLIRRGRRYRNRVGTAFLRSSPSLRFPSRAASADACRAADEAPDKSTEAP